MSYSTNAAGVSKYTAERHQRILQELVQQPGNDVCADCKSRAPRWSSWNLGIFICVQCASIHRKIGTHVTKVKSVNLDAWSKEQVESVKNIGNIASNAKWNPNEARHPPPTNLEESERDSEMEKYIRAKYETKKFLDRNTVAPSSSSTPIATSQLATSTPIPRQPKPKVEETDPSQTVPLGFGRESRVEFNLSGMGVGGDIWDGIVQQKKVPPRSKTAPIPEPVSKVTPPPVPTIPAPVPMSNLPSRSISAQPPAPQLGVNTAVPSGPWGDMLALQSVGGSLPTSAVQASPLQTTNPYASLSASPSAHLPSALANRMGQTRSFTAPAPNPFFNQGHQQQPSTGSTNSLLSVPTGSSFGSVGLGAVPTGGSFGSTGSIGSAAGGMGVSPGGLNPFGTSPGVGSAFGTSPIGSFGASAASGAFGAGAFGTSTLGTSMMSPGQMPTQPSPFQQTAPSPFQQTTPSPFQQTAPSPFQQTTQPSPFQQTTMSPFGTGAVNSFTNPNPNTNTTSLSAFGAAMSPQGQPSNSPFAQPSNSPFGQTGSSAFGQTGSSPFGQASNSPFAQPASSPFGMTGTQFSGSAHSPFQTTNPGFQSTPNNALYLQPNNAAQFQPSTSPFQTSNPPFPQSNSPFQATNTNPFAGMGAGGGMNTNPFGQPQYQGQQGWGM